MDHHCLTLSNLNEFVRNHHLLSNIIMTLSFGVFQCLAIVILYMEFVFLHAPSKIVITMLVSAGNRLLMKVLDM